MTELTTYNLFKEEIMKEEKNKESIYKMIDVMFFKKAKITKEDKNEIIFETTDNRFCILYEQLDEKIKVNDVTRENIKKKTITSLPLSEH